MLSKEGQTAAKRFMKTLAPTLDERHELLKEKADLEFENENKIQQDSIQKRI